MCLKCLSLAEADGDESAAACALCNSIHARRSMSLLFHRTCTVSGTVPNRGLDCESSRPGTPSSTLAHVCSAETLIIWFY